MSRNTDRTKRPTTLDAAICSDVATGLCALLFFIALGLALAVLARPLYMWEIRHFELVRKSGLPHEEILANYDGLIRWCMPWNGETFSLATLPFSADAAAHFEKVKFMFTSIWVAGLAGGLALFPLLGNAFKNRMGRRLRHAGIVALSVPFVVCAAAFADFDRLFIAFHECFFSGEYWLFDAAVDPVIRILPEAFFLHRLLIIAFAVSTGALGLWRLGRSMDL